jgi:hypothetical protein
MKKPKIKPTAGLLSANTGRQRTPRRTRKTSPTNSEAQSPTAFGLVSASPAQEIQCTTPPDWTPQALTIRKPEAAALLRVSTRTLDRILKREGIRPVGVTRRPLSFRRDVIEALAIGPLFANSLKP